MAKRHDTKKAPEPPRVDIERREALKALSKGSSVVATAMFLGAGWAAPSVEVLAAPAPRPRPTTGSTPFGTTSSTTSTTSSTTSTTSSTTSTSTTSTTLTSTTTSTTTSTSTTLVPVELQSFRID